MTSQFQRLASVIGLAGLMAFGAPVIAGAQTTPPAPGGAMPAGKTAPAMPASKTPATTAPSAATAAPAGAPTGTPVFPSKVDPKYAKMSAGKARMETCKDQYHANKANGGNAGMKWIQKGGGYYSACEKHLKSA